MSDANTQNDQNQTDRITVIDDAAFAAKKIAESCSRTWRMLIVDDDAEVHQTTEFVLQDTLILGRQLEILHAYSGAGARQLLEKESNIAVIVLDVVMESDNAGLELIGHIRDVLEIRDTRIILRTGQPGYAPEDETIHQFDIHDYKTKSELTFKKLLTAITTAIRSYDQIRTIDASRRGLELIVASSATFMAERGIRSFAAGVITQISALFDIASNGLVCAQGRLDNDETVSKYTVIAASGHYQTLMNRSIDDITPASMRHALAQALSEHHNVADEHGIALYFGKHSGRDMAAFFDIEKMTSDVDQHILGVFCANLGVCLQNINLVNQLHDFAYYDQLLKLPNRTHFIERINTQIADGGSGYNVALLDIDDFAETNDVLGHRHGDALLHAVAQRLTRQLGTSAFVARISGDMFGVLGPDLIVVPDLLCPMFNEPFQVETNQVKLSISMGFISLSDNTASGTDVIKDASFALKRAKLQQKGQAVFFTREMGAEIRERTQLSQNLRNAFDHDRLFVVYQPQITLATGKLIGVEALLRWRTEDGRLVPPDKFIPLAEYSGLIVNLGEWVLRTACHVADQLRREGIMQLRMAVNVSVVQFRQENFLQVVTDAMRDTGIGPDQLELEITESVAMLGVPAFEASLEALRSLGVSVAIDDFGTGYSSLSYLDRLSVDCLKIDRAFVDQISKPGGPRIADMITQLGHKLGLRVLAEGIEEREHWDILQEMGCHEGQGFYIARPMEAADLLPWILQWNAEHPVVAR